MVCSHTDGLEWVRAPWRCGHWFCLECIDRSGGRCPCCSYQRWAMDAALASADRRRHCRLRLRLPPSEEGRLDNTAAGGQLGCAVAPTWRT